MKGLQGLQGLQNTPTQAAQQIPREAMEDQKGREQDMLGVVVCVETAHEQRQHQPWTEEEELGCEMRKVKPVVTLQHEGQKQEQEQGQQEQHPLPLYSWPTRSTSSSGRTSGTSSVSQGTSSSSSPTPPASQPDSYQGERALEALNERLKRKHPRDILRWALATGLQVVQFTSCGISGMCIIDMLHALNARIPIVFIDTLYHFPQTLDLVQRAEKRYGMTVQRYTPNTATTRKALERYYGSELWLRDPELYLYMTKVEPTGRALRDLGVELWLTGRRRSQGKARADIPIVERAADGRIKVNPLACWDWGQVWAYIEQHQVPHNPLLHRGYKSVGDLHSTAQVSEEAPERAGRSFPNFSGECGMHTKVGQARHPDHGNQDQHHQRQRHQSVVSISIQSLIQALPKEEDDEEHEQIPAYSQLPFSNTAQI